MGGQGALLGGQGALLGGVRERFGGGQGALFFWGGVRERFGGGQGALLARLGQFGVPPEQYCLVDFCRLGWVGPSPPNTIGTRAPWAQTNDNANNDDDDDDNEWRRRG